MVTATGTGSRPSRSATAADSAAAWPGWLTHRYACSADTAPAASMSPSSARCGALASKAASFALAGSDSMPLAMSTAPRRPGRPGRPGRQDRSATDRSFRPAGKAAPPRPVSPDRSTSSTSAAPRNRTGPYRLSCAPSPRAGTGSSIRGSPAGPATTDETSISTVTATPFPVPLCREYGHLRPFRNGRKRPGHGGAGLGEVDGERQPLASPGDDGLHRGPVQAHQVPGVSRGSRGRPQADLASCHLDAAGHGGSGDDDSQPRGGPRRHVDGVRTVATARPGLAGYRPPDSDLEW